MVKGHLEDVLKDRIKEEFAAGARIHQNDPTQMTVPMETKAEDICKILDGIYEVATTRIADSYRDYGQGEAFAKDTLEANIIRQYLSGILTVLDGGNLFPITGDESEWSPIDIEGNNIPRKFISTFRGKPFALAVSTLEANRRYPHMRRMNHDNGLIFITDFIRFATPNNDSNEYALARPSVRFVEMPYCCDYIYSPIRVLQSSSGEPMLSVEDLEGCGITEDTINDKLIFRRSGDGKGIIASPIPIDMLPEYGVPNVQELLDEFNTSGAASDTIGTNNTSGVKS